MQNLGKIIFILMISINIFAGITTSVNTDNITQGDNISFIIKVKSSHSVKMPNIARLCQTPVNSTSTQTIQNYINGKSWQTQSFIYTFAPSTSCVIRPMKFKFNGKTITTKAIKIHVHPPQANSNSTFLISYTLKNKYIYRNEPFLLTLRTKLKNGSGVVDSNFTPPALSSNFKIIKQTQISPYRDGDYTDAGVIYLLAARHAGHINIPQAEVSLGYQSGQNPMFNGFLQPQLRWKRYFSNTLHVSILPVPKKIPLVGSMAISLDINKTSVEANRAVNAVVTVKGYGNFSDIGSLKPQIQGVAIFANSPKISYSLTNHTYHSLFTQKMTFVADKNFTIAPFKLTYFDPKLKKIITIKTKAVSIHVTGATPGTFQHKLRIIAPVAKTIVKKQIVFPYKWIGAAAVAGFVAGVLIMLLAPWRLFRRTNKRSDISLKDTGKIITTLMQHKDDQEVKEMIDILETKMYVSKDTKVDMKKLKELKKRYGF